MPKLKTIRGLPEHLADISREVAYDLDGHGGAASAARIAALRQAVPPETFYILENAVRGIGPRLMQQKHKRTTKYWQTRIDAALNLADHHYKKFREELGL